MNIKIEQYTLFLLIAFGLFFACSSHEENEYEDIQPTEEREWVSMPTQVHINQNVECCGVMSPIENLNWLRDIAEKAIEDTVYFQKNYLSMLTIMSYYDTIENVDRIVIVNKLFNSEGRGNLRNGCYIYDCDGDSVVFVERQWGDGKYIYSLPDTGQYVVRDTLLYFQAGWLLNYEYEDWLFNNRILGQ